jgi:hypothetical protein
VDVPGEVPTMTQLSLWGAPCVEGLSRKECDWLMERGKELISNEYVSASRLMEMYDEPYVYSENHGELRLRIRMPV